MLRKISFIVVENDEGKIAFQLINEKDIYDNCFKSEDKKKYRITLVELEYNEENVLISSLSKIIK